MLSNCICLSQNNIIIIVFKLYSFYLVFCQIGGACSFVMLDLFDRCLCRESHLFKRSVLLIKAWCSYESRTLGSRNGLMATYALEVMIICLLVTGGHKTACVDSACVDGHSSTSGQWHGVDTELPPLTTPLEVLRQFLHYYGSFEWGKFAVTVSDHACGQHGAPP